MNDLTLPPGETVYDIVADRARLREALTRLGDLFDTEHNRALDDCEPSGYVEWVEDLQAIVRGALHSSPLNQERS